MRKLYTLAFALPFAAAAQTTHTVHVGGSTSGQTPPYYTPQNLTIQVGDSVAWVRDNGTHNVDGRTSSFPANPEGFYSGASANDWTNWGFRFHVAGTYNYHCNQEGHSATQFGRIIVEDANSVGENQGGTAIAIFPVPTNGTLVVDLAGMDISRAEVLTLDGRQVLAPSVNGAARLEIGTDGLAAGHYFLRLVDGKGRSLTRAFRKE